jgi:hypothetical protein
MSFAMGSLILKRGESRILMPAGYEKMRDKFYAEFKAQGMKPQEAMKKAKAKAARIWNSQHPLNPVHPGYDD